MQLQLQIVTVTDAVTYAVTVTDTVTDADTVTAKEPSTRERKNVTF